MGASDKAWESRVLCSDGNCIGTIGPDGRCKECGRPYEGQLPHLEEEVGETAPASDDRDDASGTQAEEMVDADGEQTEEDEAAVDDGWEQRTLCIDGSCIGVIGPDGRCKVCGKPYPG